MAHYVNTGVVRSHQQLIAQTGAALRTLHGNPALRGIQIHFADENLCLALLADRIFETLIRAADVDNRSALFVWRGAPEPRPAPRVLIERPRAVAPAAGQLVMQVWSDGVYVIPAAGLRAGAFFDRTGALVAATRPLPAPLLVADVRETAGLTEAELLPLAQYLARQDPTFDELTAALDVYYPGAMISDVRFDLLDFMRAASGALAADAQPAARGTWERNLAAFVGSAAQAQMRHRMPRAQVPIGTRQTLPTRREAGLPNMIPLPETPLAALPVDATMRRVVVQERTGAPWAVVLPSGAIGVAADAVPLLESSGLVFFRDVRKHFGITAASLGALSGCTSYGGAAVASWRSLLGWGGVHSADVEDAPMWPLPVYFDGGNGREPIAAAFFAWLYPKTVVQNCGLFPCNRQRWEHQVVADLARTRRVSATPDGLLEGFPGGGTDLSVLEIKCLSTRTFYGGTPAERIADFDVKPRLPWVLQALLQAAATGRSRVILMQYHAGAGARVWSIPADSALLNECMRVIAVVYQRHSQRTEMTRPDTTADEVAAALREVSADVRRENAALREMLLSFTRSRIEDITPYPHNCAAQLLAFQNEIRHAMIEGTGYTSDVRAAGYLPPCWRLFFLTAIHYYDFEAAAIASRKRFPPHRADLTSNYPARLENVIFAVQMHRMFSQTQAGRNARGRIAGKYNQIQAAVRPPQGMRGLARPWSSFLIESLTEIEVFLVFWLTPRAT